MKESIKESGLGSKDSHTSVAGWKYWLAVNRDNVAATPIPLPAFPTVAPTPQMLIGFDTVEKQAKCQRFLLCGRLDKVQRFMNTTLPKLARKGKVVVKTFDYPQKPSRSGTHWSYGG